MGDHVFLLAMFGFSWNGPFPFHISFQMCIKSFWGCLAGCHIHLQRLDKLCRGQCRRYILVSLLLSGGCQAIWFSFIYPDWVIQLASVLRNVVPVSSRQLRSSILTWNLWTTTVPGFQYGLLISPDPAQNSIPFPYQDRTKPLIAAPSWHTSALAWWGPSAPCWLVMVTFFRNPPKRFRWVKTISIPATNHAVCWGTRWLPILSSYWWCSISSIPSCPSWSPVEDSNALQPVLHPTYIVYKMNRFI